MGFLRILGILMFLNCTYCQTYPRNVTKVLDVTNPVQDTYGSWHGPQFCAYNMYATGYQLKVESFQHAGDDSGLNAILLMCSHIEDPTLFGGYIESGEGLDGNFGEWKKCAAHQFLVGYELFVDKHRILADDHAAVNARFRCRGFQGGSESDLTYPFLDHEDGWGKWTGYSGSCPPGSAICGIKTKIDNKGHVGLVDAHFFCCGPD